MAFSKPNYSGSKKFKTTRSLKEDEKLVVRILPPMGSLGEKGVWSVFHKQHFGYGIPSFTDPTKIIPQPFYCPERMDYRTKTVTQACPECDEIRLQKEKLEVEKAEGTKKGLSPEAIKLGTSALANWTRKHNLDAKHYINVKLQDGTFTTLKIPFKAKKALDSLVNDLLNPTQKGKKPVDPIDADQGVWFEISRTGKALQTEYRVAVVNDVVEVEIEGEVMTVEKVKLAPLTEADARQAEESCFDLSDVGIRRLDVDRIQRLVKSGGEPEQVAAILGAAQRSSETSPAPVAAAKAEAPAAPKQEVKKEAKKPEPAKATPTPAATEEFDPNMDEETFNQMFGGD
jgi:hypothetical protein